MQRSYAKNILRTFKSSRSRFLSIFAIVALGVGFLAGLSATPVDMKDSVERYMDDGNFYDLRIVSTMGLTGEDVAALQAAEGVEQVQPAYSLDVMVKVGTDTVVGRAHSLPPEGATAINRLQLVEGHMPQGPGECVVEAGANVMNPAYPIGTVLTAQDDEKGELDTKLAETQFTVVGIVHNPIYFSFEREPASVGSGSVDLVFYLPDNAFAYESYTELYLTATGAGEQNSMEEDYQTTVDAVKATIEGMADARCQSRYDGLKMEAQQELDDAWQEYNDAAAEAEQELSDAAAELEDGRRQLADGEQEVLDGERELLDGQSELNENETKVEDGAAQLADALAELQNGEAEWQSGYTTLISSEQELADAKRELEEGQRQYDSGLAAYQSGVEQADAAERELETAKDQLEEGRRQYEQGAAAYQAGLALLAESETTLKESKTQLDGGWAQYNAGVAQWQQGKAQYEQLAQMATAETACAAGTEQLAAGLAKQGVAVTPDETKNFIAGQAKQPTDPPATPDDLVTAFSTFVARPLAWQGDADDPAVQAARQTLTATHAQLVLTRRALNAGMEKIIASGAAADEEGVKQLLTPESLAALAAQVQAGEETLAASKQTLDAGQKQYDEGYAKWQAGVAEAQAKRPELEAAKATLDEGQKQYDEGYAEWQAGKAQLAESWPQLETARRQLENGWRAYHDGQAAYDKGKRELEDSRKTLADGWATLTDKQLELEDAKRQIADARITLADARVTLADARITLAEKTQELRDGEIEYADAKAKVDKELADAKAEIEDGEQQLADLEFPEWYVWDRSRNVSYSSFEGNVTKLQAITTIFPIFFFLVAALVVSSTMTRMVDEERLQIGTLKALGYRPAEIVQKYLWYAVAASVLGTFVGLAVGFYAFPTVIWSAYTMMYYVPKFYTPWLLDKAVFAGGSLILLSVGVSVLACRASLNEVPAALLLPRAPKAGKRIFLERITPLWRRLPFTYKVTARNLMRYKRRFWMTVIGVAGCTALLVAGFGISDSLNAIIENQYSRVYHYQLMTVLTDDASAQDTPAHSYLFEGESFSSSLAVCLENEEQDLPDGSKVSSYLMVPENTAAFAQYANLHNRLTGEPTPLQEEGVVLTEKLASLFGVKAGDSVTLQDSDGNAATFPVSGVCEHYVYNYIYMSAQSYQNGFGQPVDYNAVLSLMPDDSVEVRNAVSATLLGFDNVASVTFTVDSMQMVLNMLTSINAVVVLIIVCAACLAFVVLYNLNNINIAERVKEIATIKVLGFYDNEVRSYVNRESVALTLIGTALGLLLGIWLHQFIIVTVEVDAVMFGRAIKPISFVYAAALTLLFSGIVNFVMGMALKRISMVESMKAPE